MPIIEVTDLRKVYGGRPVVDGVGFAVEEGEIFGILGTNGAGKTTTVECIEGLRVPDSGTVRVDGLDPIADRERITRILGVQLQESRLQNKITVREALELHSAIYAAPPRNGRKAAGWEPLAERLGLTGKLSTQFADLSGGQKQRLFIALALIGDPRIVVLDELTTGLDPRARRDTWRLIEDVRDAGVTVLLVTHLMEEAQRLCDRVAVIDSGRLVALDTPDGLISGTARNTEIAFTPSRPVDEAELAALPEIGTVRRQGDRITIHGSDTTVNAVITLLARHRITAHRLRVTDATLDDAFLNLTDKSATEKRGS
ncbi:multidrug ABC transporter ATP-binding protein [Actinomadura sp. NBRC 104412]|uniref:ABC transporter ATP-binding protein n=1 Tax=Actinomadura sp. NBRC 104412 TaxID=3032203 RepID=UPI0024A16313|nr:ABC transporter ATP-binding protein [Actinomadura sp. NBRC 104412]GLZ07273.1 multidrug ABC transporter ATP-binding protein [Actinomadura sp. NBRC 104412]